jgi:SAM-dependent methyltransferase
MAVQVRARRCGLIQPADWASPSGVHDHASYRGPRHDLLRWLSEPRSVLDVGCNEGAFARALRARFPGVEIRGIDVNPEALARALPELDQAWALDLDDTAALEAALGDLVFDHVVAGDVLEHTVRFERVTGILYRHLAPAGRLVVSVPNWGHWHTLWVFLSRRWRRNERGIFDRTHRTVIMQGNLPEFLAECPGGEFRLLERRYRLFETNRWYRPNMALTHALAPLRAIPYVRDFITLGYVFSITRPGVDR